MSFRVTFTAKINERKQERLVLSVKTNIEPKRRRYTNENKQRTFSNELLNVETGSKKLAILSCAIVCFHPSVSLNNKKIVVKLSEDKIADCEKIAGLRSGIFSDLNSTCQKVLVPVEIFQFQDMLNENHFRDTFRGHCKQTINFNQGA